jgi:hypothetical protein
MRAAWQAFRIATICVSFSGSATAAGCVRQREPVAFVRFGVFRGDEQRGWRQDCRELRVHGAV